MSRDILEFRYHPFFRKGVLLLGEPFCNLREPFFSEEVVEDFGIPTVGREEEKKVFDVSTSKSSSKVFHRLISQIGAEYDDEDRDRCVWLRGHAVSVTTGEKTNYGPFLTS